MAFKVLIAGIKHLNDTLSWKCCLEELSAGSRKETGTKLLFCLRFVGQAVSPSKQDIHSGC